MYSAPRRSSSSRVSDSAAVDRVADPAHASSRSTNRASALRLGSNHERATRSDSSVRSTWGSRRSFSTMRQTRAAWARPHAVLLDEAVLRQPIELPAHRLRRLVERPGERTVRGGPTPLQAVEDPSGERLGQDAEGARLLREVPRRRSHRQAYELAELDQRRRLCAAELPPDAIEQGLELAERLDPLPNDGEVAAESFGETARRLGGERRPDLRQGQAEPTERDDRVEPLGILRAVLAVAGRASLDRLQQADPLVVAQCPNRQARRFREISDPQRAGHTTSVDPDVT